MYAGSSYSFFMLEAAAMAVGIAKGALDAFGEGMATRMTAIPPPRPRKEDPDYQRWYGTAAGIIATAEAARHNCAEQWTRLAEQGAFTKENDMELVTISKEIVKMCWRAVQESLARPAGSTAMRTGECIERSFRDLATIHAHNGIVAFGETATRELAKARFGVE
jgi:3-hydroxy-9,10-secoandrosta-1,3,5(10)-triene-9,17-dione monooxygenase